MGNFYDTTSLVPRLPTALEAGEVEPKVVQEVEARDPLDFATGNRMVLLCRPRPIGGVNAAKSAGQPRNLARPRDFTRDSVVFH